MRDRRRIAVPAGGSVGGTAIAVRSQRKKDEAIFNCFSCHLFMVLHGHRRPLSHADMRARGWHLVTGGGRWEG